MSKIITKKQLDLVVESTMKEAGLVSDEKDLCEVCESEECTCNHTDLVDESAKELAESINGTTTNLLNEDMSLFNKLINYRNK